MDLGGLVEVRIDAQLARVRTRPGERRTGRLLHDVAERSGQRQHTGAGHPRGLDKQHLAAGRRPCQPDGDSGVLGALLHFLVEETGGAQHLDDDLAGHDQRVLVALRAAPCRLSADRADLALEIPDTCFTRVPENHRAQPVVGEAQRLGCEAVVGHLLGHEVLARYLELLDLGVAGKLEHFHAVAQRRRNRIQHVGRGDEEDLRQIERHIEVVVAERVVLLRVEHFEQRRAGVAAEVRSELVYLVEDEHRVLRFGPAQALHDLAGQRADVGAPMAADLGLVAHAAQRHADELAIQRAGDGLGHRGLSHARGADKTEDRPFDRRVQLAHGEVLDHPVLRLVEPCVLLVEDALGARQVDDLLGPLVPGQRHQPVQVRA